MHVIVACDRARAQRSDAGRHESRGFHRTKREHCNIHVQPRSSIWSRTPPAHTRRLCDPRGAPSCTAHQRHALDLYTFRAHTWANHSPRRDLSPSSRSGTSSQPSTTVLPCPTTSLKATPSVYYINPPSLSRLWCGSPTRRSSPTIDQCRNLLPYPLPNQPRLPETHHDICHGRRR